MRLRTPIERRWYSSRRFAVSSLVGPTIVTMRVLARSIRFTVDLIRAFAHSET